MTVGTTVDWQHAGIALGIGYLLGSIPFGLIFAWLSGAGDVRKIGSGSIGATNVLRTGNRWAAAGTLLFDAAKGVVAVLLARVYLGEFAALAAALGAVLGHLFPVWLKFKGGKGIATAGGVLLALYWPVALLGAATWLIAAFATRISSLSSLIATVLCPIYMLLFGQKQMAALVLVIAVLIVFMHRANISRLMDGAEPRIGKKAP
ncbi:MAG: glycerol-3-phosphate 1-O-acyltransferase PlsY [Alphaproteobacteria bacterium]|nr:glycerol-3-phosphate 1-O-acyltransferase PlsY [Alphaproteobacteria bacterium]